MKYEKTKHHRRRHAPVHASACHKIHCGQPPAAGAASSGGLTQDRQILAGALDVPLRLKGRAGVGTSNDAGNRPLPVPGGQLRPYPKPAVPVH